MYASRIAASNAVFADYWVCGFSRWLLACKHGRDLFQFAKSQVVDAHQLLLG
jgi:hypothetical protein